MRQPHVLQMGHAGGLLTTSTSSTSGWTRCPTTSPPWATLSDDDSMYPEILAGRHAPGRQGDHPLPHHHLAHHPARRWACRCPSRCSATAGWCWTGMKMSKSHGQRRGPGGAVRPLRQSTPSAISCMREMPFGSGRPVQPTRRCSPASTPTWPMTWAIWSAARWPWWRNTLTAWCPRHGEWNDVDTPADRPGGGNALPGVREAHGRIAVLRGASAISGSSSASATATST